MPDLERIENPQMMEVQISGPGDANRLYIFTGTAVFNWHRTDDDSWARGPLYISMRTIPGRPVFDPGRWIRGAAVASLASVYSRETGRRDEVGFAVDSATPSPPSGDHPEEYGITAQLALRGNDTRLYRISFQLTVLAEM
jgi:hypothetical protein